MKLSLATLLSLFFCQGLFSQSNELIQNASFQKNKLENINKIEFSTSDYHHNVIGELKDYFIQNFEEKVTSVEYNEQGEMMTINYNNLVRKEDIEKVITQYGVELENIK